MILTQHLLQAKKEIDSRDAEIIFCRVLGISEVELITDSQREISEAEAEEIVEKIALRKNGQSISEIFGMRYFYGLEFFVTNDVLTPRPETEFLVDFAVQKIHSKKAKQKKIIDIGTGSGCIITTIASQIALKNTGNPEYLGVDISAKALLVAQKNTQKILQSSEHKKVELRKSDLCSEISGPEISGSIIVTNLPYIPQKDEEWMTREVLQGDPHLALFSGKDGLDLYRKLFAQLREFSDNGYDFEAIAFEFDPPQEKVLQKILLKLFPEKNISFHKDFSGEVRFGVIEKL